MAAQTLFNRAVGYHLPTAIPTTLERIDEFSLGKVLLFHKRPHKFMPWRKHELDFTGYSLSSLLAEGQNLQFSTASNFLFDVEKGVSTVDVQLGLDAELKEALVKFDMRFQTSDQKKLNITADFGRITHVSTDLFPMMSARKVKVNTEHPVVREAIEKGGALFIISTIYEAERCCIQFGSATKMDDSGRVVAQPGGAGGTLGGTFDEAKDWTQGSFVTGYDTLPRPV